MFRIKPTALKQVCDLLKGAVSTKSTKRIFECARISYGDRSLPTIAGTYLERAIVASLPTDETNARKKRVRVIPLEQLQSLSKAKADQLEFVPTTDGFTVCYIGSRVRVTRKIEGEDPDQYPEIPESYAIPKNAIPADGLGTIMLDAQQYTGKEAARFVLNALKLGWGGVTSCDGRRLYHFAFPGLHEPMGIIGCPKLPPKALRSISHVKGDTAQEAHRTWKFVDFYGPGFLYRTRTFDGTLPDKDEIVPKKQRGWHEYEVNADQWLEALDAMNGSLSMESPAVLLSFKNATLTMHARRADSEATAEIDLRDPVKKPLKIGFNPPYLRQFLKHGPSLMLAKPGTGDTFGGVSCNAALFHRETPDFPELVLMPVMFE